jgi:hypothetical protein
MDMDWLFTWGFVALSYPLVIYFAWQAASSPGSSANLKLAGMAALAVYGLVIPAYLIWTFFH